MTAPGTPDPDAQALRNIVDWREYGTPLGHDVSDTLRRVADRLEAGPRPIRPDDPEPAEDSVIIIRWAPNDGHDRLQTVWESQGPTGPWTSAAWDHAEDWSFVADQIRQSLGAVIVPGGVLFRDGGVR